MSLLAGLSGRYLCPFGRACWRGRPSVQGCRESRLQLYIDIEQAKSQKVSALWDWWNCARGLRDFPDRQDFDPVLLKSILPWLLIADVEPSPFRIRYRLVGTRVAQFSGFDFTGGYLDEIWPGEASEPWLGCYRRAYDSRSFIVGSSTEATTSGASLQYEFGAFPLSRGGSAIEQFVCVEDYFGDAAVSAHWSDHGRLIVNGGPFILG